MLPLYSLHDDIFFFVSEHSDKECAAGGNGTENSADVSASSRWVKNPCARKGRILERRKKKKKKKKDGIKKQMIQAYTFTDGVLFPRKADDVLVLLFSYFSFSASYSEEASATSL